MTQTQERIVVGVDGSAASIDALRWATHQASLTDAAVEAVIAWESPDAYDGYPIATDVDWASHAQRRLEAALGAVGVSSGARTTPKVVEGHPAHVLIEAGADANLLVVGSRGHGGFVGMLLGSVSERVAAHAACPVVVIRHPVHE